MIFIVIKYLEHTQYNTPLDLLVKFRTALCNRRARIIQLYQAQKQIIAIIAACEIINPEKNITTDLSQLYQTTKTKKSNKVNNNSPEFQK